MLHESGLLSAKTINTGYMKMEHHKTMSTQKLYTCQINLTQQTENTHPINYLRKKIVG